MAKLLRNTHTSENVEFWRLRRPGEQEKQVTGSIPDLKKNREHISVYNNKGVGKIVVGAFGLSPTLSSSPQLSAQ